MHDYRRRCSIFFYNRIICCTRVIFSISKCLMCVKRLARKMSKNSVESNDNDDNDRDIEDRQREHSQLENQEANEKEILRSFSSCELSIGFEMRCTCTVTISTTDNMLYFVRSFTAHCSVTANNFSEIKCRTMMILPCVQCSQHIHICVWQWCDKLVTISQHKKSCAHALVSQLSWAWVCWCVKWWNKHICQHKIIVLKQQVDATNPINQALVDGKKNISYQQW